MNEALIFLNEKKNQKAGLFPVANTGFRFIDNAVDENVNSFLNILRVVFYMYLLHFLKNHIMKIINIIKSTRYMELIIKTTKFSTFFHVEL